VTPHPFAPCVSLETRYLAIEAMASSSRSLARLSGGIKTASPQKKLAGAQAIAQIANFATTSAARKAALSSTIVRARPTISRQFVRSYADAPAASLSPKPAPKRGRFRTFTRWTWRLTYVSLLAGVGYVIYDGWASRHPDDQFDADPSKKTLVVLGKSTQSRLVASHGNRRLSVERM
jgi:NADH:ubiquinone reductase (non-electrogenic)